MYIYNKGHLLALIENTTQVFSMNTSGVFQCLPFFKWKKIKPTQRQQNLRNNLRASFWGANR